MYEVEKHIVKSGSKLFEECDKLCFLSKNLYNATLYAIRQHYFATSEYLGYNNVVKLFIEQHNPDYYAMNTKVSQLTIQLVDANFSSFFALLKKPETAISANIPKYLHKTNGRQVAHFNNQAFSFNTNRVPKGYIKLSGTNIMFKTKVDNPEYVKVTRLNSQTYIILVGYEVPEVKIAPNDNFASIDLGVNNLAAITFTNAKPIIINGRPVKSINRFYNKEIAKLQSKQDLYRESITKQGKDTKDIPYRTKLMDKITNNREQKINNYFHKATHYIVNQLVSNNISLLIIGYTKGWKQGINMGDKENQNFVQIPFLKFVNMLKYKCADKGIEVVIQEESYTSKASFLDKDYIATYGVDDNLNNPSGNRTYRGLYTSKNNTRINADINASLNIMRKYLKVSRDIDIYDRIDLVGACSTPSVFTVK